MPRLVLLLFLFCLLAPTVQASTPTNEFLGPPVTHQAGGRADIPVLTSFAVGGAQLTDAYCTGLGWHAGIFWVMGSDFDGDGVNGVGDNGVYFYLQDGTYAGAYPQPTQDQWGWGDTGYDGNHIMVGAGGVHGGDIFWVNPNTLQVEYTVSGCPWSYCRAIAIEGIQAGAIIYRVGNLTDDIATMRWTPGNNPAQLQSQCPSPGAAYGLAFDSGNNVIWVASAESTGSLYQIDPTACSVLQTYDMTPEVANFGGALMAGTTHGCQLWTLCQCDPPSDRLYGWSSGGDNPFACSSIAVEPVSWGQVKARYRN